MPMTREQWNVINDRVSTEMLNHVRAFVTPLTKEHLSTVRTVGTGTYVHLTSKTVLLTCEHVAREAPLGFRFCGSQTGNVFSYQGEWTSDPGPAGDIAYHQISPNTWGADTHQAAAVPYERFAVRHHLAKPQELLFFMGFAGENSRYGFGHHDAYGSGYLSQQKLNTAGEDVFEMLWMPGAAQFATSASDQARANMAVEDARGFSGSLAWNTRYLEISAQGRAWAPQDAVVTGLVRRWDQESQTLLIWRVEHVRTWLENTATSLLHGE